MRFSRVLLVAAGPWWAQIMAMAQIRPGVVTRVVVAATPCDSTTIVSAAVVRNNDPVANYYSAPTYHAALSRSGTAWTAAVPAEAYDLTTPYLVRFMFQTTGGPTAGLGYWLEAYHPGLTVLTPEQATTLHYITSVTTSSSSAGTCFVKVTLPDGRQVASMSYSDVRMREVTDDWPAGVGKNGQYGLQLWYFATNGVFTKKGEYTITLSTCVASATSRFYCQ